jgi:hypothetical protein
VNPVSTTADDYAPCFAGGSRWRYDRHRSALLMRLSVLMQRDRYDEQHDKHEQ